MELVIAKFRYLYFPFIIFALCFVVGRNVFKPTRSTVHNTLDVPIYVALYNHKSLYGFTCTRVSDVHEIMPGKKITLERPRYESGHRRKLIFSRYQERLLGELDPHEYVHLSNANIGKDQGHIFYIGLKNNILNAQSDFERRVLDPLIEGIRARRNALFEPLIIKMQRSYAPHKHDTEVAHVRHGRNQLAAQELEFSRKRFSFTKPYVEKLVGMPLQDDEVPKIALCFSGGGYRAMTGTIGFLIGAKNIGLLDSAHYITALSGSSWAVAPWILSGKTPHEYREGLYPKVAKDFLLATPSFSRVFAKRAERFLYNHPFSWPYEIFGAKFSAYYLSHNDTDGFSKTLSSLQDSVHDGAYPLPLFTMTDVTSAMAEWFEASPYEIGSDYLDAYIPTWGFGRYFVNAASTNFAGEQSLGFMLAVFGSAPSGKFLQGLRLLQSKGAQVLAEALEKSHRKNFRMFNPIEFPNFSYGMPHSPFENQKRFQITDAGLDINLPLPPLLKKERGVDVIVCFDMGNFVKDALELRSMLDYATRKNLAFPAVDLDKNYAEKTAHVLHDKNNADAPVVILLPLVKNEKYSKAFDPQEHIFDRKSYLYINNWKQTKDQVLELSNLCTMNLEENKDLIVETIKEVVEKKRQARLGRGGVA
jgi:phospholipase A2